MRSDSVSRYVAHGRRRVAGWFSRIDAEIVSTIMLSQTSRNVKGDALEIGVHHGKTFILLKLCLHDGETAIAVDVFENQELNKGGRSGKGDRDRLEYNLKRFADGTVNTDIITTSSLDLKQSELKARTSGLRFASIDGGHWYEAVLNDLRLAAHCAGGDCVLAIDDSSIRISLKFRPHTMRGCRTSRILDRCACRGVNCTYAARMLKYNILMRCRKANTLHSIERRTLNSCSKKFLHSLVGTPAPLALPSSMGPTTRRHYSRN